MDLPSIRSPVYKSEVIYNGFDFKRIEYLENEKNVKDKFNIKTKYIVGMVASFSNKKDYDTYIKAAILTMAKENNITFLCIGSGDDSKFKAMVPKEFIDRVKFLGKQENVENIMNICNIGLLTTFTEGISNSLLEFMALSKPVIVSGEGGCSELISNGKNGFLLKVGDFKEISNKILFLLKNINLLNEFGDASRKIVEQKFSISCMHEEFRKSYTEIILSN